MALEKSKLIVEIEAKNVNTKKEFGNLSKEIKSFSSETEAASKTTSKAIGEIEKKYSHLAASLARNPSISNSLLIDKRVVENNQKTVQTVNSQISGLNKNFQKLNKNNDSVVKSNKALGRSFDNMDDSVNDTRKSIAISAQTISDFIYSAKQMILTIDLLTSPEKIERFSKILKGLSYVMRFKGNPKTAELFLDASKNIEIYGKQINDLVHINSDFWEKMGTRVGRFEIAINAMEAAILGSSIFFGTMVFSGLLQGFINVSAEAGIFLNTASRLQKALWELDSVFINISYGLNTFHKFLKGSRNLSAKELNHISNGLKRIIDNTYYLATELKTLREASPGVYVLQKAIIVLGKAFKAAQDYLVSAFNNSQIKIFSEVLIKRIELIIVATKRLINAGLSGFSKAMIKNFDAMSLAVNKFTFALKFGMVNELYFAKYNAFITSGIEKTAKSFRFLGAIIVETYKHFSRFIILSLPALLNLSSILTDIILLFSGLPPISTAIDLIFAASTGKLQQYLAILAMSYKFMISTISHNILRFFGMMSKAASYGIEQIKFYIMDIVGTFSKTGTVGAARVNVLQQAVLNLKFSVEVLSKSISLAMKNMARLLNSNLSKFSGVVIKNFDAITLAANKFSFAMKFGMVNELYFAGASEKISSGIARMTKSFSFLGAILSETAKRFKIFAILSAPALMHMASIIDDIALMAYGLPPVNSLLLLTAAILTKNNRILKVLTQSYKYLFSTVSYTLQRTFGLISKYVTIGLIQLKIFASNIFSYFKWATSKVDDFNSTLLLMGGSFSKVGTVGAARVNVLQQAVLNLKFSVEVLSKSISLAMKNMARLLNSNLSKFSGIVIKNFDAITLAANKFSFAMKFGMVNELYFAKQSAVIAKGLSTISNYFKFMGAIIGETTRRFAVWFILVSPALTKLSLLFVDLLFILNGFPPLFFLIELSFKKSAHMAMVFNQSFRYLFSTIEHTVLRTVGFLRKIFRYLFADIKLFVSDLGRFFKSLFSFFTSVNGTMLLLGGSFSKTGTAGAASVNFLQKRFLDLVYTIEVAKNTLSNFGKSILSFFSRGTSDEMISSLVRSGEAVRLLGKSIYSANTSLVIFERGFIQIGNVGFEKISLLQKILLGVQKTLSAIGTQAAKLKVLFTGVFSGLSLDKMPKISISRLFDFDFGPIITKISSFFALIGNSIKVFVANAGYYFDQFRNVFVHIPQILYAFVDGFRVGFMRPLVYLENTFKGIIPIIKSVADGTISLSSVLRGLLAPSIYTVVKLGAPVGSLLSIIGFVALSSESAFVKLAGTIALVVSVALVGLSGILTLVLSQIGSLVTAIGDSLINAMSKFEEKSVKFQSTLNAFEFTLKGFIRTFGVEAIGSIDRWNEAVMSIVDTSSFGVDEVRKSIKMMVSEGAQLKLSVEQMDNLLIRSVDVATLHGKELSDVVLRMVKGLTGQSQALIELGINLNEHAVETSSLTKEYKKTGQALTENQKKQIRYGELLKQTTPLIGAAVSQLETIDGSTKKYAQSLELLQAKLGTQSNITIYYTEALNSLVNSLSKMPEPIFALIGSLIDISGVGLKVIGIFLQYFILFSSILLLSKILNITLAKEAFLFNTLTKAINWAVGRLAIYDTALKASIVTNNSLMATITNLSLIIKGMAIASFKELVKLISQTSVKVLELGQVFIKSAMFSKIAVLGSSIGLIVIVLTTFKKEIGFVVDLLPRWLQLTLGLVAAHFMLDKAFGVNLIKMAMATKAFRAFTATIFLQTVAVYGSITSWTLFATAVQVAAVSALVKLKVAIIAVIKFMGILNAVVLTNPLFLAAAIIAAGIASIAQAASQLNDRFSELEGTANKSGEATRKIMEDVEKQSGFFVIGLQVATATLKDFWQFIVEVMKMVLLSFRAVYQGFVSMWLNTKKLFGASAEEIKRKMKELSEGAKETAGLFTESFGKVADIFTGTQAAIASTTGYVSELNDTLVLMADKMAALENVKTMEIGNEYEKARLVFSTTLVDLERLKRELVEVPKLSEESMEKVTEIQKKISDKQIESAQAWFKMEKMKIDAVEDFAEKTMKSEIDRLKSSKNLVDAAKIENKIALERFEKQASAIRSNVDLSRKEIRVIDEARKALKMQNAERMKSAAEEQAKLDYGEYIRQSEELINKTREWNDEIRKVNQTRLDGIKEATKEELARLKKIRTALEAAGLMTYEKNDAITEAEKTAKQLADSRIASYRKEISGEVGQTIQSIGGFVADAGTAMGGVMQGVASQISAFAGTTGSMILGLILRIPSILEGFAGIVDQITDFPNALFNAFGKLFDSIINLFRNFIPNLIDSVPKSLIQSTDFLNMLSEALSSLVDNLPDMIDGMLERMPEIAMKFVQSTISLIPKIIIAYFKLWLIAAPKIVMSILKMLPELIRAVTRGIYYGIKEVIGILSGVKIFGDSNEINKAGKKLAEAYNKNSEMFQVSDLELATGIPMADKIAEAIENGHKKGANWAKEKLQAMWDKVEMAWKWIVEKLQAMWDKVEMAWTWIVEKLQAMWDKVEMAWKWIIEKLQAMWDKATEGWNWIVEKLGGVWEGIKGAAIGIIEGLKIGIQGLWSFFIELGTKIWEGLKSGIQSLVTFFSDLGGSIWAGLKAGLNTVGSFFTDMFSNLKVGSLVSKLFSDPNPGKGPVETALSKSGVDIDIPFLKFAKGTGMVPGNPMVPGDSEQNDRILALLSPGEAVIPRSLMANPMIKTLVNSILGIQGGLPKYSIGGVIKAISKGDVSGAISEASSTIGMPSGGFLGDLARGDIESALKQLDPSQLAALDPTQWNTLFWDKMVSGIRGVLLEKASFDKGGMAARDGMATLHAGEIVLANPIVEKLSSALLDNVGKKEKSEINSTINVKFEINTTQPVDDNMIRNKLWPEFKKMLRRESLDGKRLIEITGIG